MKIEDAMISTQGLGKRYGKLNALDSLDMQVEPGAIFGLLGPNGAGKSTTFGILCGFLRPTSGVATVLGLPPAKLHRLRGKVAVLPQDARFPPQVTVRAQLNHYCRLIGIRGSKADQAVSYALERVGMLRAASMRGSQLSHGMVKRVGLAQAILGQPEIVLLDEPTAGLDPKSARQVKELIAELTPETTVVVSSHNLVDIQEICTHGAILDHGKVVAYGTIGELTRQGAEITLELGKGDVPLDALRSAFGESNVAAPVEGSMRIMFNTERDVASVIKEAVQLLFQHDVALLGITRGTSLEAAFLEVTGAGSNIVASSAKED